ncbi:DUF4132 domain-containing protein [Massilia violaceinigra]|uniref:DUF4132 domain-containing protein n=1 Tax=Massilia violaceinigra TaxID=2045208 RepID=A0ABY4A8X3_9BURK|nr:DUF4132 domain-containing protein [Massilia violaceinigra]UOD30600.1 DUF4132 domain-containing protein [Massilia violaceinigra]
MNHAHSRDNASGAVAPWLAIGPLVDIPAALAAEALPSRRFPGPAPRPDTGAIWDRFIAAARQHCALDPAGSDDQQLVGEAAARIASGERRGSPACDAVLLAVERHLEFPYLPLTSGASLIDVLAAERGLPHALDALIGMEGIVIESTRTGYAARAAADPRGFLRNDMYHPTEMTLRSYLALAPDDVWEECVRIAHAAIERLYTCRRPLLAALLPDAPHIADAIALTLQPPPSYYGLDWLSQYGWLLAYARSPEAMKAIRRWRSTCHAADHDFGRSQQALVTIVRDRGVDAIDALKHGAMHEEAAATALACIGTTGSLTVLALACDHGEAQCARFALAAGRWPQAAIAVLSELIGRDHCGPARARRFLAHLVAQHAASVPAYQPWLSPRAWKVLSNAAAHYLTVRDVAAAGDLPPILANPPWTAAKKKATPALTLAPLPLAPSMHWSEEERASLRKQPRYTVSSYKSEPDPQVSAEATAHAGAAAIIDAWLACLAGGKHLNEAARMIADLPAPLNAQVWNAVAQVEVNLPGYAIATLGLEGLPGLVNMIERRPAQDLAYARHFGAVELAAPVARAWITLKNKELRASAGDWLLANPEHAACGLIAPALGKPGGAREQARAALRLLGAAGHRALLLDVADRYGQDAVTGALRAMLDEDPLDLHPAKIAGLPPFWTPHLWARPLLAASGKALPEATLDTIGDMLRFPHVDGIYAGVAQLKEECTPDSLADFAWELFRAWVEDGAQPKENWAFFALGLIGNDDSARRLTPLLRAWPGESLSARAIAGLDVLALIGSDTALMLLNGIAQKVKFKALQDRARDKIAAIAGARGLSTEELEDRLAPDLDLDEQGTLLLDFGPRQFRVGFDETLKPCVRDSAGTRLPDLPKPKKSDDPVLSAVAVKRYTLLKKDARTIAAQQVLRLEMAMCAQRRWQRQVFIDFLAHHALLRHLVQRLVWGLYSIDGNALLACFRVASDGTFTTAADDPVDLPPDDAARIGIVHALGLPAADAHAFARLFADYELLQPFAQIGRDTYRLDDAEAGLEAMTRWNGNVVPSGRVMGMVNQGWRRGPVRDGGSIWTFTKALAAAHLAELHITPGLVAGNTGEYPEQTVGEVRVGRADDWGGIGQPLALSALDPVVVSELIRDMNNLCA